VGTRVQVVTPDDAERARQVLAGLPDVVDVQLHDGALRVNLSRETADFSFIAEALLASKLRIAEIKPEEVDLETAFMRLTKGIVQ
jgi:ABC-2 type transport system ATP-binding protein